MDVFILYVESESEVKKSEKNEKNRLEFRFALFRFEAKITKSKRSEKFKAKQSEKKRKKKKNAKNSEKSEKKRKNRLEFRFALFRSEAKITQVKRSEKFEEKISEKKQKDK
jgi:hypothetical protein